MTEHTTPADYYRAARELLPDMDEAMRQVVQDLLEQAEQGQTTDTRILEVIAANKQLQRKFREALSSENTETMGANFSPAAGNIGPVQARKFKCPVPGHIFVRRIQKSGEESGNCPIHKVALVPMDEEMANDH